jgi:XTP/dITP diphosphohydrolase
LFFYAKIGSETKDFDIADVCTEICEKLIHRPHIYSDTIVKMKRKKAKLGKAQIKEGRSSVLEGVPKVCHAL